MPTSPLQSVHIAGLSSSPMIQQRCRTSSRPCTSRCMEMAWTTSFLSDIRKLGHCWKMACSVSMISECTALRKKSTGYSDANRCSSSGTTRSMQEGGAFVRSTSKYTRRKRGTSLQTLETRGVTGSEFQRIRIIESCASSLVSQMQTPSSPASFRMMYCCTLAKAGAMRCGSRCSSGRSYCSMKAAVSGRSSSVWKSSVKVVGPTMAGTRGRISEATVRGCHARSLMIAG
mmetsp:Transcript_17388/g.44747  ORF Transcript_17388/g.44747 Transcript_17388/m.44747 type:complete len:230 (+) Transcript_17388:887-1576(+)